MSENISTFGFENEDIKGGLYDKYKAKQGQIDRCAIIYTDPKAMFAGSKVHFKDRYFLCRKGSCCDKLGPSKWRVGSVLIKYGTDKQGNLKKPFSYDLYPWIFSEVTYLKLKNVNSEFPLASHDIKINCTNEEYQHLDILPCTECIWTAKEDIKKMVLDQAKPLWDFVKRSIAQDLTVEEINDLIGVGTPVADPSSALNLDDVLSKV